MKTRVFNGLVTVFLILILLFPYQKPVIAAAGYPTVFDVTTIADGADDLLDDGVCMHTWPTQSFCTLRAAMQEAQTAVEHNDVIINIPWGVYILSIPIDTGVLDGKSGDLDLEPLITPSEYEITIQGTGAQPSIIDADSIDRVLHIGEFHKVTLRNLIITGGSLEVDDVNTDTGGGIKTSSDSEVLLDHILVYDNEAICSTSIPGCHTQGGGIFTENADLYLQYSQVLNNRAYIGSAIYAWDGGETVSRITSLWNSTINDNTSGWTTIFTWTILWMLNTTIANNYGPNSSSNIISMGPLWVQNSTLIYPYYGSNVVVPYGATGSQNIRNSVFVSYISKPGQAGTNCDVGSTSPIVSKGGNVFTDMTCNPNTGLDDVVVTPAQVLLGMLEFNGGVIPTMKPTSGSPAIDRKPGKCIVELITEGVPFEMILLIDARDFPRDDGVCDAGAVEVGKPFRGYLPMIRR